MVKKYGLWYAVKYYNLIFHAIFALVLYLIRDYAFDFFCMITQVTERDRLFYKLYGITVPILLIVIWVLIFFTSTREKAYRYKTGRSFGYDSSHYKRSYYELVDYFADADPMKMDIAALPTMSWKESSGLIFGKKGNKLISYEPNKNGICAMVWGAPGDGKTTSTIITSCRQFGLKKNAAGKWVQKGAVMVTDLKGDIYEANKKYRRIKRFSTIHWQESAHYDPLVDVRKMKNPSERAIFLENLAITIIPEEQGADSKYFVDGARDFFTGISLYLLNQDSNISFPAIIEEIVIGNYSKWVLEIMKSEDKSAQAYTNHFYGENEKNVSGTYSKLVSSARLFGTDIMKTLLTNDDNVISPADLENCIDIYIQVDPNQITLMAPVIAMLYQAFMSAMLYRKEGQDPPIAFVLDEFGQIPAMPVIAQSAALMRAYNCSLLFSCQSLAMLEKHYGVAGRKLLMDCVKVNCFLSIMDPDTRDWASRLIGTRKVLKISNSEQQTQNGTVGRSVSEAREKIFEPEAFGDLPNTDELVIYYKGKYVKAEKTYYFK
jgi:type IV secretory pathway TraG/TraD family ATPase VirD4